MSQRAVGKFSTDDVARFRIALAQLWRAVNRTSADVGYTRSQLSVLGTVVRRKSIGLRELAEIEGLNPTMLSRVVSKLEEDQLITRLATAEDRRAVQVQPTAAGRNLHLKLRSRRNDLLARLVDDLPPERAAELLAALAALELLAERAYAGSQPRRVAGVAR